MAKVSKSALLRAEQAIAASIAQADACVALEDGDGKKAQHDLLSVLKAADQQLALRLLKITPKPDGSIKFSAAQAIAYQAQIKLMVAHVQHKLEPIATEAGAAAISKSMADGAKLLSKLEQEFKGVSTSPSVLASMQQSQVARGPKAALVTRVATSVDRYGLEMGRQFSRIVQVGLASGASQEAMVRALVEHGGPKGKVSLAAKEVAPGIVQRIKEGDIPEGLFVRHKYWAERIIRTETAHAYSGARLQQLRQMKADGMDDVRKKIVAHFDKRTAPDSVAVHGQVRELEETFMDGAGRVYLHPPGRPNDRETLIAWFDDWTDTPSTEPPTVDEQAEATDLATSDTMGQGQKPPVIPRSTEELHQLEVEARGLHEDPRPRAQVRAELELAHAEEASHKAETLAIEVLDRLRAEKLKAARTLELALAKQKAEEEALSAKAAKKAQAAITKASDGIEEQVTAGNGHLAALDLYALAGTKPKVFAGLIQQEGKFSIPELSITGAINVSPEVVDNFITQTLEVGYAKFDPGLDGTPLDEQLTAFKQNKGFVGWLDELAGKGDNVSKKQLTSLFASEGMTWDQAAKTLKSNVATMNKVSAIKLKYHPPVVAPSAVPKVVYTIKTESGYQDIYDPTSGVKLGYFKTNSAGKHTVNPPEALVAKLPPRTFTDPQEAAAYAVVVSKEIQANPLTKKKTYSAPEVALSKAKNSKFNRQPPSTTTTRLGPINLDPGAKKQIAKLQKEAAEFYKTKGVTLRGSYGKQGDKTGLTSVDSFIDKKGYLRQADKWSGERSGCWYASSAGPKSHAGLFVAQDRRGAKDALDGLSPEEGGTKYDGHFHGGMVAQVDPGGDGQKYFDHCRVKYAATQAALEIRRAKGELAEHVDADGYVMLYRGVKGVQSQSLRYAREEGVKVKVELRSTSSWTVQRGVGESFAGPSGVVLRARVHISRIYSQYEQERIPYERYQTEHEWIVIAEDVHHEIDSADIENPYSE